MRGLLVSLALADAVIAAIILTPPPVSIADAVCPAQAVRVRYRADLADYHDMAAKGTSEDPQHYRIAYCKPTGIVWAGLTR